MLHSRAARGRGEILDWLEWLSSDWLWLGLGLGLGLGLTLTLNS